MTRSPSLRDAVLEVGRAVRSPEELALAWRNDRRALRVLIPVLLANAAFGVAAYGLTMGMHAGAVEMLRKAVTTPLAAGLAWSIALPALYIFGSAAGSRASALDTVLAAGITVCFGAWAMLASVPVNWFFSLAIDAGESVSSGERTLLLLVNFTVFTGVGLAMFDVFHRVRHALDPESSRWGGRLWVLLLLTLGAELFFLLDVFTF